MRFRLLSVLQRFLPFPAPRAEGTDDLFHRVSEAIPQMVWLAGPDGRLEFNNRVCLEYTGLSRESFQSEGWQQILHPEDVKKSEELWGEAFRSGGILEVENRIRRASDGTYRWHHTRAIPILDSEGKITKWFGTCTDIHDQKTAIERTSRIEAIVSRSANRFRSIIDQSPFPTQLFSPEGRCTQVNRAWQELWGMDDEAVENHVLRDYNIFEDELFHKLGIMPQVEQAFAGGKAVTSMIYYDPAQLGAPGQPRWVEAHFNPVVDAQGKLSEVILMLHDVTEKKERAELQIREQSAQETSRLKSEFLANMSHEVRTPINGVIGMTGLLLDTPLSDEQREYAEAIRSSADTLLDLVNGILDLAKIEAGKMDLEVIEFDIHQVIQDIERTFIFACRKKNLSLNLELDLALPERVKGDSARLRQIFNNLLSNAIKFTEVGGITLRARLEERSGEKARVRFEVEDTGVGIPKEALERLFKPFMQADASTTRKYGGTGLGLSICRKLTELMGGQIGVSSESGKGSTFWFTAEFSLALAAIGTATESLSASRFVDLSQEFSRPMRILVAEDNPVNQKIALKILEKMGLRAEAVGNGAEAVAALSDIQYDLILMDCQMPEMDGYEATRQIRKTLHSPKRDTPIVAMTANAIQGDREKCLAAGMNDYLAKPVQPADLARMLKKWLSSSRAA